ncbi:hypothetical protein [Halomarina pelagica]|uniref:hypothetical protein n=1 Tax=Halomarina pelagica TaxID=2961599 RepID=UPI0020C3C6BB|nr:hypothetical protein [Halomarina sp. BND7]
MPDPFSQNHRFRKFALYRHEDASGVSGTGVVAYGVQFPPPNGKCVVAWVTNVGSVSVYDNMQAVQEIHGHEGGTEVIWE